MSVADKLNTLRSNIVSAYDAIEAKSGTVPTYENTQGLANAISTIPQYNPLTLAYISYASATTAQPFVNLMASNETIPVGGASYAFAETDGLTSLDLSSLDFSAVTDTVCMFDNAADLTTLTWDDVVDMGNVETMEGMYRGTTALTSVDLSKFATGEYLESVFNMFASSGVQNVNLGAPFDTSAVTDFYGMFNTCTALTDLYHLNNLRMDSATNVGAMFYNCSAMTELNLGEGNRGKSKNLLDVPSSYTINTAYASIPLALEANTAYTIQVDNITTDGSGEAYIALRSSSTTNKDLRLSNSTKSVTVTPTADIVAIWIYADYNYASSVGKTTTFTNLMVSEGTTATDYEPYEPYQLLAKQGLATPTSDTEFWNNTIITQSDTGNGFATFTNDSGSDASNAHLFIYSGAANIEASTNYTVIMEIEETSEVNSIVLAQPSNAADCVLAGSLTSVNVPTGAEISGNTLTPAVGTVVYTFTTKAAIPAYLFRWLVNINNGGSIRSRITLLAGDHSADWQNYAWEPYAFTPPSLSLSTANADYMLAGMTNLQSLDLSGWKSGSDDLASSHFWTGSRNLCKSLADTKTQSGVTMTRNADGTYTATGIPGGISFILPQTQQQSDEFPAGTYTASITGTINDYIIEGYAPSDLDTQVLRIASGEYTDPTAPITFTTTETLVFRVSLLFTRAAQSTSINYTAGIQIEEGSTNTQYMPYGYSTNLTTLTLNGPKRLVSGKLADSLVATFNSKQGSTISVLKLNNPEFFTTDGTTATLTDFSDVWSGSALTTLEMTGWDVSGVDPTDNSASVTLTNVASLTSLTIGDWTTPANGVNLATLLGVDNEGSQGYSGAAKMLSSLHITGSSVLNVYNSGTGEFKSSNAFAGCPIGNGTGHILVPANLVNSYKADSFWSAYASIITAES